MGIDAKIYVEGPISDAEFDAAEAYLIAREYSIERTYTGGAGIDTPARYYGPGYERGPWPYLYGGIQALRGAFPDRPVFYGGDTWDDEMLKPVTDEELARIWEHWRGPDGRAYYRD